MMAKTGPTAFFFLMIARPRTSTLFPYTTLFRSNGQGIIAGIVVAVEAQVFFFTFLRSGANAALRSKRDRKSTRLNSSHLGRSYAVFCLKKKGPFSRATPADPAAPRVARPGDSRG